MITFRHLKKADYKDLLRVYSTTIDDFREYSEKTRKFFVGQAYVEDMFSLKSKFGAFEKGKMIGYMILWGPHGGVAYIYWFAILKEFRHKGIGKEFMNWIEKWCLREGVHNIQLQADERNLKFYKDLGYEVWGIDKQSYFGVDTNMMRKIIQEPKEENYLKRLI
jgi:ribosomal protein S18 acetylase RimI-like enzyme